MAPKPCITCLSCLVCPPLNTVLLVLCYFTHCTAAVLSLSLYSGRRNRVSRAASHGWEGGPLGQRWGLKHLPSLPMSRSSSLQGNVIDAQQVKGQWSVLKYLTLQTPSTRTPNGKVMGRLWKDTVFGHYLERLSGFRGYGQVNCISCHDVLCAEIQ